MTAWNIGQGKKKMQSRCLSGAANAGGSLFLNAAERPRSDGLNTSGPFISVIILQQYGESHWRFVWYKLYSRWYAVIRPFESPSVSAFLLTLSSSLPSPSLFCPHSSWRAAFRALHHSTWRAIKLLGNFCKDAATAFRFCHRVPLHCHTEQMNRALTKPRADTKLQGNHSCKVLPPLFFFFCKILSLFLWQDSDTFFFFFCPAEVPQPLSSHLSYDMPSRYDVTVTLSYAVEFIVCTAADYRCLTCHTGDLKRQQTSPRCILLARWKAWGMLGSLVLKRGFQCSGEHAAQGKCVGEVWYKL